MTIGEQLQNARKTQQFTQQEVADTLHVARQTISNWETGRSYPDIASLLSLSRIYALSLDDLLKGDGEMVQALQAKEQERRLAKGMFWGSWAVNVVILGLEVLSYLQVPGTAHGSLVSATLVLVLLINLGVLANATVRYRRLTANTPLRLKRWVGGFSGLAGFALIGGYLAWGLSWTLAGMAVGLITVGGAAVGYGWWILKR
ncbi:helix-turn-helix domain-containing protein [Lacticaseibacillus baoqingensis]|uniref:Helix-turn-helix domain-containing protein n=1 Tax=Lacticaseibacillus baoqingensis TaxID=2486013 RepID=A0ABW4E5M4_9LACO|nr:helix-turn-helix transcriptional regulator [Lacticaseibacillus baoqingensis]